MSKWFSMAGRRALVTGASLGIGRSLVLGFADQGPTLPFIIPLPETAL